METLFAVVIILGLLLVVSMIGLQQNLQAQSLKDRDEKAAICRQLATAIETASNAVEQVNIQISFTKPVWVAASSINFSADKNDFYCLFNADVNGARNDVLLALKVGTYTIRKNTLKKVEIVPYCPPLRCGLSTTQCGVLLDGCGGQIDCGCCSVIQQCTCGRGQVCTTGTCQSGLPNC